MPRPGGLGARWQRLSKRQQLIAMTGGAVFTAWAVDAVVFRPLRVRVRQLREEVRRMEQRLATAVVASRQAASVDQAFEAYAPYLAPSGSPDAEVANVISEVETAVRESGMVLLNLKPGSGGEEERTVSVTIEAESTPVELVTFLARIKQSPRLIRVTELRLRVSLEHTLRSSLVISKLLVRREETAGAVAPAKGGGA